MLWIAFTAVLLALAGTFFTYRERSTFNCPGCLSTRHEYQWRIGFWSGSDPALSSKRVEEVPSFTFKTIVGTNHTHTWVFAQGSPYFFLGTKWGGCALGRGRHKSEFGKLFEEDTEFRDFVFGKIAAVELTTNDVSKLILIEPIGSSMDTNAETQVVLLQSKKLLDEFFKKP